MGCKWSNIAKKLLVRTENSVKNRFKSLVKKERRVRIRMGNDKNKLYLDDSTLD